MKNPPAALADSVNRDLSGERVLWSDSPNRIDYAMRKMKTALFGIPFLAFAVFWTWGVFNLPAKNSHDLTWFMPLWGLMFCFFGLSMLLSPLLSAYVAGNIYYVVTDKRIVIFEKRWKIAIRSFPALALQGWERLSHDGQRGNVVFQRDFERGTKGSVRVLEQGFFAIENVLAAEHALERLHESKRQA